MTRPLTIFSRYRPSDEITLGEVASLAATSGHGGGHTPESFEGEVRGRESRGVLLSDGRILATYHAVGPTGTEVDIQANQLLIKGLVTRHDSIADLALIEPEVQVDPARYGTAQLGTNPDLTPPGFTLSIVGPDWMKHTVYVREWILEMELRTTPPIGMDFGWSGCPVLDPEGNLEGLLVRRASDGSYAVVAGELAIHRFLADDWRSTI